MNRSDMRVVYFLFLFFAGITPGLSQSLSGRVLDKISEEPIPFANIIIEGTNIGAISDIDGKFSIDIPSYPSTLHAQIIGYHDTNIVVSNSVPITIYLRESIFELAEARIVAGVNPAIPIIQKAVANRKENNPETNHSFYYKTYSKMVFGPEVSTSTNWEISDSLPEDSTSTTTQKTPHYLFVTESITERKYLPPNNTYEKVIANRVSGLKAPTFTLIASEFQPFSYSTDYVNILGLEYLSPLARNSQKNYLFDLVDSLIIGTDTLYHIQFQPRTGTTFNGITGQLTINKNKYAVQNIKFKQSNPNSSVEIEFEQMSSFIDGKQWFPTQFNSHIVFKIENSSPQNGVEMEFINAQGRTYIHSIQLDSNIAKKEIKNVALELGKEANNQSDEFWEEGRKTPLSEKEKNTYTVIDSLGEKLKFDNKLRVLEAITTGFIPMGPVSIPLNSIIDYSDYEGVRLGLGLRTNDNISKFVSVGGYGAYGFKDDRWKYGADIKFDISREHDISAGVKYENDISASGEVPFYKTNPFDIRTYNKIYLSRMDMQEGYQAYVTFRALKDFQNRLFFNAYSQSFSYDYTYAPEGDTNLSKTEAFRRNEIGWSFRFGYKEKYIRTFGQNVSLGTKFPYVWARLAHSNTDLGSTYQYTKLDVKIEKTYTIKGVGKLGFQVEAGTTTGDVPSSLLHYGKGMRISGFNLYIQNTFNTMAPNEFLSQQYLSIHLHNNFGALYKSDWSAPEVSLVTSMGWGNLDNQEWHQEITFSTMERGFFESGLLFDNIIILNNSGIGVGAFYRYGPYALPNTVDNFGFSATFMTVLQ